MKWNVLLSGSIHTVLGNLSKWIQITVFSHCCGVLPGEYTTYYWRYLGSHLGVYSVLSDKALLFAEGVDTCRVMEYTLKSRTWGRVAFEPSGFEPSCCQSELLPVPIIRMSTNPLLCTKPVLGRSHNNNTTSRSVQDRVWFPWLALELVLVNASVHHTGFSCFPTRRHSEVGGTNGEGALFLVGVRLECLQLISETEPHLSVVVLSTTVVVELS